MRNNSLKFRILTISFFILLGFFGLAKKSEATIFFTDGAESYSCDSTLPSGNYAPNHVENSGFTRCGETKIGSKFLEWDFHGLGNTDLYTEVRGQSFPISCSLGKTYYIAFWVRFDRIGGNDIWHIDRTSVDKFIEFVGNGIRWIVYFGKWGHANNQPHHFTTIVSNVGYNLNPEISDSDRILQNSSGYNGNNPIQLNYEQWYAIVFGVKMDYQTHNGSVELWVNGVKVYGYL